MSKKNQKDDEFSAKLDLCLTDGVVKTGLGFFFGAVSSLILLKRRKWPFFAGGGIGIGNAWANCEIVKKEDVCIEAAKPPDCIPKKCKKK